MVLRNWLETLGHGYRAEVTEGGDGGGGVAQTEVEEDGIDLIETSATSDTDEGVTEEKKLYDQYDVEDPTLVENEAAEADEAKTVEPVPDEQSPSKTEVGSQQAIEEDFPPELLERAGQLGFTYQNVKDLGTTRALQTAVDQQVVLLRQAVDYQQSQQVPAAPDMSAFDTMREKLDQMREEGMDEQHIALTEDLISQNERQAQEHAELQQTTQAQRREVEQYGQQLKQQMEQSQRTSEARALVSWFDEQLGSLDKSYDTIFGTGATVDSVPGSAEYKARDKVMIMVNKYQADWQGSGYKSDNDPKIFSDALHKEYGDHEKTTVRNDLKQQLRQNGRQVTARPTHTESQPLDRRERALVNADNHQLFKR
jgi:hypothetical protein